MINDNEVRKQVGKSLEETMRDYIDGMPDDQEDYIYTGRVVNNNDPEKNGKVQVRVFSVYDDDIQDSDLPWALPDFSFVGSLVGNFTVPPVGAIVNVYFDKGDIYLPHYTTKAVRKSKQPTQKDTDYPDNVVMWEMDEGDYLTLNRKTKETTFNHNSGTKVLIKKDGTVEITIVKDKKETVKGKTDIENTSDVTIKSTTGKISIEAATTLDIKAATTLDIKGTVELVAHGTPAPGSGIGPFCLLPSCLYTGAPHQTTKAMGEIP